jgi:hypothetical protein
MTQTNDALCPALPEVISPRKMSTAWCAIAFEELTTTMKFIEAGMDEATSEQKVVWERYKTQTVQFAHDMLLAEGDRAEIRRRLKIDE